MVSDFAVATLTLVGGGLLLAKNCAIILPRKDELEADQAADQQPPAAARR